MTFSLIAFAQGRAASYETKEIAEAISPGRWQLTQWVNSMGAISLQKVGARGAGAAALEPGQGTFKRHAMEINRLTRSERRRWLGILCVTF